MFSSRLRMFTDEEGSTMVTTKTGLCRLGFRLDSERSFACAFAPDSMVYKTDAFLGIQAISAGLIYGPHSAFSIDFRGVTCCTRSRRAHLEIGRLTQSEPVTDTGNDFEETS